jgi:hypothetical protein
VNQEGFLDTNARGNFADYEALSMGSFAIDTNNGAFENLNTELIAFLNLLGNTYSVAERTSTTAFFFWASPTIFSSSNDIFLPFNN